jgi:hypothetical protein
MNWTSECRIHRRPGQLLPNATANTISPIVLLPSVDAKPAESRLPREVALRTWSVGRALVDDPGYSLRPQRAAPFEME